MMIRMIIVMNNKLETIEQGRSSTKRQPRRGRGRRRKRWIELDNEHHKRIEIETKIMKNHKR